MKQNLWRQKQFVKRLLALSLNKEGDVDFERVEAVLTAIRGRPYLEHKALLRRYHQLVRDALRKEEARIRYAGAIRQEDLKRLERFFSKAYGRGIRVVAQEAPELIAGFRVRIGDDVYDDSVWGRLKQLCNQDYYQ